MGLITWDQRLATGHSKIDEQHKALIEAFNNLHGAMKQGKGKEAIGTTLVFLKDYTVEHFAMEESLMKQHSYPMSQKHLDLHQDLVCKVADLVDKYQSGQTVMTMQVMDFLEGWLVEHIQGEDYRLAEYLRAKGIR